MEADQYGENRYRAEYLYDQAKQIGIELLDIQIDKFIKYYDLLIEWNKVMNLTTITDFEDVVLKHFIDSISILMALKMENINNMIDVGTGAGFPGIPLKIICPHVKVVLLDSLNKRVRFLNEVITECGLDGTSTVHGRAEDCAKEDKYREKFDLSASRAVANLASLSEYCMGFVKPGGYFISYKSGKVSQELKESKRAISIMGGNVEKRISFQLGEEKINRTLVIVKKVKKTPKGYPRKAGMPTKEPIM